MGEKKNGNYRNKRWKCRTDILNRGGGGVQIKNANSQLDNISPSCL